jgi:hypothetical protein
MANREFLVGRYKTTEVTPMAQTGDTPCENPRKSPVAAVYDRRPAISA